MNDNDDLHAAHVGLDLYAPEQMLVGLSFMRSRGAMNCTDVGIDGLWESRLNTTHSFTGSPTDSRACELLVTPGLLTAKADLLTYPTQGSQQESQQSSQLLRGIEKAF